MSLDVSVLYLALPSLSKDLGASDIQQLWIMDIYEFMLAGFLVTMGTLGDRIGRRKLLVIGAAAFSVASVVAANASSATTLIAARAALGIAGATLMPSTLALISNMFTVPRQRGIAIAIWMNCFMVGMVIGPLVGGILLERFRWGSVFLLGVPVMLVLLVTAPFLLPEYRDEHAGTLDLPSVALYLAGVLPTIYGVKVLAKDGWRAAPITAVLAGMVMCAWFLRRQAAIACPLLDLRLFLNRAFSAMLGIMLVIAVIMGGLGMLIPLYLQLVAAMPPFRAGVWMIPQMLGMVAGSTLAAAIGSRVRTAYVIASGLLLAAGGLVLVTQVGSADGVVLLTIGFVATTVGISPAVVLGTDLVVGSAAPEQTGSAASTSETSNHLGIALGVAFLGSVVAAVYHGRVALPAGLPAHSIEAARGSIVGAVTTAEQLSGAVRDSVLVNARAAFTAGLNVAAAIGAVVFIALAIVAATMLRHARPGKGNTPSDSAGARDAQRSSAR
jgi:DHA2 family multidrug resistance protein-like MFS transporter